MWQCSGLVILFMLNGSYGNEALPNEANSFFDSLERLLDIPPEEPALLPKYDFIIVGAGSAGCVVANRLSENPEWKILLIEAGTDENPLIDIPLTAAYLQMSSINWNYTSKPNPGFCRGMNGGKCNLARGRVMGGTSAINYMIYTRGNAKDYDEWRDLGNNGWSFDDVLPYFKKIENFTIDDLKHSYYHNSEGYLNVGYAAFKTPFADVAVAANKEYGLKYVDFNGKNQIGVSLTQTNLKDGFRHTSNGAYIVNFRRPNLHVKKLATVRRILINDRKEAYGVEFVSRGKTTVVTADREVVVSAGAINSPQLLMLSGIGPKRDLAKLNIRVRADLPVGKNLMDHIGLPIVYTIDKPLTILKSDTPDIASYLQNGGVSILSIPASVEVIGFHNTKHPHDHQTVPDIELAYMSASIASDSQIYKNANIKDSIYEKLYQPIADNYNFMIVVILLSPKSRGDLKLVSVDYRDHPTIRPNYFDHPDDIKTLIAGIRLANNITQQPAFKEVGTRPNAVPLTECPYEFDSDEYIECFSRTLTGTVFHYSGTCRMGPKCDPTAVVDERLRVHGIRNLRVIDASVMPKIVRGHTNSPAMMIGEKGSDLIKEDWNPSFRTWVQRYINLFLDLTQIKSC